MKHQWMVARKEVIRLSVDKMFTDDLRIYDETNRAILWNFAQQFISVTYDSTDMSYQKTQAYLAPIQEKFFIALEKAWINELAKIYGYK